MNRDDRDDVDEAASVPMLVEAARRGTGSAMDALFRRFAPVVHGVLLGYVQKADADDLTQEVFETAMQRLGDLREAAAFPGWLLGIARHAALDAKRRRVPLTGIEIDAVDARATHEDRLDAERALAAIRGLPEAYRETSAVAPGRRPHRPGDRRAHRPDRRQRAGEPASRHGAAARGTDGRAQRERACDERRRAHARRQHA